MNGTRAQHTAHPPAASGSALIAAIWVIGLLSILVGSFAFDMHLEARITSHYRKRIKADYLARAGVEKARMLLVRSAEVRNESNSEEEKAKSWYAPAKSLSQGAAVVGLQSALGEGVIVLDIVPEPSRRNINKLQIDDWERILEVAGVPEEDWPGIIDSFMDWIDPDDDEHVDGAETDNYYALQDPPYRAKNGPLDTVEESLLIRNFYPSILFGGVPPDAPDGTPAISGAADLLTVYGDGQVNVNAAPIRILMTLPGVDERIAQDIIEERTGSPGTDPEDAAFKSPEDFFGRFPDLAPTLKGRIVTSSSIFRVRAVGSVHGVRHTIGCIVGVTATGTDVLRWWESQE